MIIMDDVILINIRCLKNKGFNNTHFIRHIIQLVLWEYCLNHTAGVNKEVTLTRGVTLYYKGESHLAGQGHVNKTRQEKEGVLII